MNLNWRHSLIAFTIFLVVPFAARAAGTAPLPAPPQLIMTWHAADYAPPGFEGRVLPSGGARVRVSFELVEGGVPADTSKEAVRWFYGNQVIPQATGHSITVALPDLSGESQYFRVELPNHKGNFLSQTLIIPIAQPQAVIEWPYPSKELATVSFEVHASPYFFNVSDPSALTYAWKVNGKAPVPTLQPDTLDVHFNKIPSRGSPVSITLTLQNPSANLPEGASDVLELTYAAQ